MALRTLPPRLGLNDSDRRQSPDELDLLKRLDELYEEGKEVRDKLAPPKETERDLKLYRGEVGPRHNPDDVYFKANFIQAFIDRMVGDLTDNRPTIRVGPRKVGLRGVAKVSTQVVQAYWEDAEMQRQTYKMCHSASTMRSAGLYAGYDAVSDDIVLEVLKRDQVVVDPMVTEASLFKQAEYLFVDRVKPINELLYRFPVKAAGLKPDVVMRSPSTGKKTEILGGLSASLIGGTVHGDALPRAKVKEAFILDRQRGKDGKPMFPNGRWIFHTKERVLWDGPLPFWDGTWPVSWFDWIVDPEHCWGRSTPELLMHMQLAFNQLMDGLVENQILANVMAIIGDWDAVDEKTWAKFGKMGSSLIARKRNRNATLTVQPPPPFGADRINLARFIFTTAQLLCGVTDVMMGGETGSLQSGQAIEGLQEGGRLPTRSRASRLEDFFKRVGEHLLARIFQFKTSDAVISLVGPSGDAIDYAIKRQEFFAKDDGTPIITLADWDETVEQRKQVFKDMRFIVAPGSSAPGSRIRRGEMMMKLFAGGLVPGEEVLKAADFPDAEELTKKAQAEAATRNPDQIAALRKALGM